MAEIRYRSLNSRSERNAAKIEHRVERQVTRLFHNPKMSFDTWELTTQPDKTEKPKKFEWYWSPVYCVAWFLLFYVAVIPSFYSYPDKVLIRDEQHHPDEFIGERAELQLLGLSNIGVKLAGTVENEVYALNYLLNEIEKIRSAARLDLYDIEVDVQYSSGKFMLWGMATSYHNVSNIVVKISPKNTKSDSYLLMNAHFDSEVGSPGAADDGVMIVILLETLRVISRSEWELKNPIVFLLNGAEEANLLASHGFITQHRWAPHCKAVINLDSAGSGGREILFQTGPGHPWLMKYYKKSALHPYASTIAEELFQNNFIPSDSDFRIFRDYGGVPGLDMAHTLNGYIYHTKYDNFFNLERGTYQTTGDNVLAVARALANADELRNTTNYAEGHTVFYDFLGWFIIFYTESTGVAINIVVSVSALLAILVSVFLMTRAESADAPKEVFLRFGLIIVVQILTVAAALGLTVLMSVIIPAMGLSQAWYSKEWLTFGLYFCPVFFVLGLFPALTIHWTRNKTNMDLNETISCFMHSHCLILIFVCLLMTGLEIRSAFFSMIAIFFYAVSVILNLIVSSFFKKLSYFLPIHLICQLLPYWFYTFLHFACMKTFVPMQGRDGPTSNAELLIAGFCALMAIHFAGFIIPILHKFRKSKIFFSMFGVLTIVFVIIAATPAGFPYKKDVAAQRFYILHTHRLIRDVNGNTLHDHSGYYIQPVDTRPNTLDKTNFKDVLPKSWTAEQCKKYTFCGLPLYSSRWMDWKDSMKWIPAEMPNLLVPSELKLTLKTSIPGNKWRYDFELKSIDRVVIYIDPEPKVKITNWSFDTTPLDENYKTPYFIYHMYSYDDTPLHFWVEFEREESLNNAPSIQIGVGGHYLYHTHTYTEGYQKFLASLPEWVYPTNWVASYENWYF